MRLSIEIAYDMLCPIHQIIVESQSYVPAIDLPTRFPRVKTPTPRQTRIYIKSRHFPHTLQGHFDYCSSQLLRRDEGLFANATGRAHLIDVVIFLAAEAADRAYLDHFIDPDNDDATRLKSCFLAKMY